MTQPDYFKSLALQEKKDKSKHLSIFKLYLFHWPLFVLGLIIALTLAYFYLANTKPVYIIKASLLIKDNKDADPKSAMLDEIGITNSSESVENEIEILKSKKLVNKVVNDLQLWTSYIKKDGLTKDDLYKKSPVKFSFLHLPGSFEPQSIEILIKDDKTFSMKTPEGEYIDMPYNTYNKSFFGTWKLEPTETLAQYKGAKIIILLSDPDMATLVYQKVIDASLANKLTTSVSLSIPDKVPQRGKDILNSVIQNYNLFAALEKNQETKSTLDFLDQRIDSLSRELTTSEKGIEGFKSSRGITNIDAEAQIQLENVQTNDKNLNEVKVQLDVIEGIEKYINSNQNMPAPATLGIVDPALSNSIQKLSDLQLQHDKLSATLPETNPDFDPINSQIRTTKAAIRENVKNIRESLGGTKSKLESFNSRFESSIKGMPAQERQYVSIKREQTSKESLYTFLLQKREEVSVKYASNLTNNRVVDEAYSEPPSDPSMFVYAAALLCAIGIPAGIIYGRGLLSNKITSVDDITDTINIPVVAELPYQKIDDYIAIKGGNTNVVSEQLRALRIKLFHLHNGKETGRVTLLTSSVPGEGKSFVSINLGTALAFAYKKTVILELDMRRPKIAKSLDVSNQHKGISEYLYGKASKEEIIQRSPTVENLDVITCGAMINNPSESLEKEELKDLILWLRNNYDDVIIDSPPIHLVPDAAILSRLSDITLYLVRQGVTEKDELNFIQQLDEQAQLHNINIIFNGIERMKYGYGYRYNEGYYTNTKRTFLEPVFSDFKNRF